jgi:predicted transcriptional regulator
MLESLFGSIIRVRVLLFLFSNKEGYAREISRFYDTDLNQIQKQLERLEKGGVLVSKTIGKTRLYGFNPRFALLAELNTLLEKVISLHPPLEEENPAAEERIPEETTSMYQSYDPDMVD